MLRSITNNRAISAYNQAASFTFRERKGAKKSCSSLKVNDERRDRTFTRSTSYSSSGGGPTDRESRVAPRRAAKRDGDWLTRERAMWRRDRQRLRPPPTTLRPPRRLTPRSALRSRRKAMTRTNERSRRAVGSRNRSRRARACGICAFKSRVRKNLR